MVFTMNTHIYAAESQEFTISVSQDDSRTYEVYQIFTGDYANVDGKDHLSNVQWGKNGKEKSGEVPEETLKAIEKLSGSDVEKVKELSKYVDFKSMAFKEVSSATSVKVPAGYYVLKDKTELKPGEEYSLYVFKVTKNIEVKSKSGTTSSDKKVKDAEAPNNEWNDSADYDINDFIPFKISAKITDKLDHYDTYKLVFHDTMSKGLTFNKDSVRAYVDGKEINQDQFVVNDTTGTADTFMITFEDIKKDPIHAHANSVISVEYTATLNDQAVIGKVGNPNTSYIEYSNNPHDVSTLGKTPEDKVKVFTYQLEITKYANEVGEGHLLKGAEFELKKVGNKSKEYKATVNEEGTKFTFKGLDAGEYILYETKTPAGYNTIKDMNITIGAKHEVTSVDPKLTELTVTEGFTADVNTGMIRGDIINKSGTVLPETGGMGTTLLYLVGGAMVLGSGIVLVSRRRMNKKTC